MSEFWEKFMDRRVPNGPTEAPFVVGSDTSKAAAQSLSRETLSHLRLTVFLLIKAAGESGMTCDEVEVVGGLKHQTASARIRELAMTDRIYDSGKRRLTRSARGAIVWKSWSTK